MSHRGYDPGALPMARALARRLGADLLEMSTTRLLVEPNRSLGHPKLFSEWSRVLDAPQREAAIERHYLPHRRRVIDAVAEVAPRSVCHIAVHSFTPTLDGQRRNADIGLLYDPARKRERRLCRRWRELLGAIDPTLRVRLNYPYRGTNDGLTTALRRRFPASRYLGIELEINQSLLTGSAGLRRQTTETLKASLQLLLD
jgi:predicted N-formylglutamate amidohydrolase